VNAHELMQLLADTELPEAEVFMRSTSSGDDPVSAVEANVDRGFIMLIGSDS
jgi:hypothetical protein